MDSSLELTWDIDPFKENKTRLGIISAIILTFLFAVYIGTGEIVWVIISLLLFIISLHKYFFKTQYSLTEDALIIDHLGMHTERNWSEFKRIEFHNTGVFLSPFKKNSRLDSFRGLYILFGKKEKVKIIKAIEEHLDNEVIKVNGENSKD